MSDAPLTGVAIIGMSGRWPGARTAAQFWRNIRDGVDCISRFPASELEVSGADELSGQANYVRARSILDDVDLFDAEFFGILPRDAELMDPQHRVFLECCWEALEDAGYDPQSYAGSIGVHAGCSTNTYFLRNVCAERRDVEQFTSTYPLAGFPTLLGAIADTLATRVSYKLNLRGPSYTVQSACSTSLVAVCQACQSLLSYQCDMVLAGGATISLPQRRGYHYQDGGMGSADGRCRPFEANATGTVFGNGAGVVLLKRLDEAIADGDHIYAVIRGSAVNNDGSVKAGFTAPGVDGQAAVIALAQAIAEVAPESISYLETHGTATPLGDPIEFAALLRAFGTKTAAKNYCALGGVKRFVGHLEMAAGVSGLICAAQALAHQQLPPAAGFEDVSPNIDIADSPFFINKQLTPWKRGATPRRAGVSSFGVGGTNAHVVLEEAPELPSVKDGRSGQLLVLSARTSAALETATDNLLGYLKSETTAELGAVAFTLQAGRRAFPFRRAVACSNIDDAVQVLSCRDTSRVSSHMTSCNEPNVVFMFPGQGSQALNMGAELYRTTPEYRADIDQCATILESHLGLDLRSVLFGDDDADALRQERLTSTRLAQPALFITEYALARLWHRWGVQPVAMIGHSVGELVAACLAGVFALDDALAIVATRARMMQVLPPGQMLAVHLSADDVQPLLNGELSLAAVNAPRLSVVSGPAPAISALADHLEVRGVIAKRLVTSHAFHSRMVEPIVEPFSDFIGQFQLHAPKTRFVSCVSGAWITDEEATSPSYWARHVREPVRFSAGIQQLQSLSSVVLLEVGPGRVLSTLARQHRDSGLDQNVVASLPGALRNQPEYQSMLHAAGQLWTHGVPVAWSELHEPGVRRCSLPTYPFERKRHWIDPPASSAVVTSVNSNDGSLNRPDPMTLPVQECPMSAPPPTTNRLRDREARIRASLLEVFSEFSGINLDHRQQNANFLELGFDSLFLTQITQVVHSKFGVRVTFRQLLEQNSSLLALASFIDAQLPADAMPAVTTAPPSDSTVAPATVATEASATALQPSTIELIIREQFQAFSQLMTKQMEWLRGVTPAEAATPPATLAAPTTARTESVPSAQTSEFKAFGPYKPPQRGPVGGLSPEQQRFLDGFVQRYTAKSRLSKEFTQQHRSGLADPRVASGFRAQWKEMVYPICTVRSQGSRLWDMDGNEYIDLLNGFGPIFFGHGPDFITDAIAAQMKQGFEIGPQTVLAGTVADLIRDLTGNERVTFCNTGSEAVMAALRLARTVTGRKTVVLFAGSYHGSFDEVLVRPGRKAGAPSSSPIAPGIPGDMVANVVVLEYGSAEALEYIRKNAQELAAVLVEPVQSRHPALQPVEFLREIRQITAASETALIFDEVVTGFRTHPGGIQALFGIRADLVTYGKVVGGGMPIGVLAGRAKFMDALDGGMWQYGDESFPETGVTFFAGTFVRHPLALAAAHAVLTRLKADGPALQQSLNDKANRLVNDLNRLFSERQVPTKVEHFASWFYFSFPPTEAYGSLLYYHLRAKGVHILEGFPCFITTAHTEGDLAVIVAAFTESITELQQANFLVGRAAEESASPSSNGLGATPSELAKAPLPNRVPLTESQVEVWLSARFSDEASCSFNESFLLHLGGVLNVAALRTALQQLVDRHDALRGTVDAEGTAFIIQDELQLVIAEVDLSSHSDQQQQTLLKDLIRADASAPFDLVSGPLVRARLIRYGPERHALHFTSHHIVCDGWSTNVLLEELGKLYAAQCAGVQPVLAAAMPFRGYAMASARQRQSAERSKIESWWLDVFAKPVAPLETPTDRPRGAVKSYTGDTVRRVIGGETYLRIKKLGSQYGCTTFATLLAGLKALLYRLTGQHDIVVGIPAAGQSSREANTLVGHCVNFLPLRSQISGDATVETTLKKIRSTVLDAYDHQDYTYGSLVQKLNLRRDPSRLPLTEVQFNLERVGADLEMPGLKVGVDPCPKSFVNFDLFFNAIESTDRITIDCDYNLDLFDTATVERWLGHFETLLAGMAEDPNRPVSHLPILNKAEQYRLLVEWNATDADYPRDKSVHQLIAEQAARTPAAVAAICGDEQLTYAQLDREANRLANLLRRRGVGAGARVAVCLERSVDMLIGLLGTLKAGAAYVPLDPDFPRERISAVLADAEPALILTQDAVAARLELSAANVVSFEEARLDLARESDYPCPVAHSPEAPAYVIYTSGSTGQPKGVQVSHRAVVNLLTAMARRPGLSESDTLLAVTTLAFDIAALELYLPLCVGAKVVIATRDVLGDGFKLLALMKSSATTVMQATPSTWRILLEAGWAGPAELKVLCGGEALSRDLADALCDRSVSVWNMYGPTETTVWSAVGSVEHGPGPITIGPPIANTQFYVLDAAGQPAPIGVTGELHIAGEGVATGYWNRQALTAEKFVTVALQNRPGTVMYKTGDLVRARPDGTLEFLGRLDTQVKVRGFRIETAEVELVLKQFPGMRDCVVVARPDASGEKQLVAYYTSATPAPVPGDLRRFVGSKLPAYMVPSVFVLLDTLPLTPNGKFDRRALPAPDTVVSQLSREIVAPRSPREQTLAAICAGVLGLETLSVTDSLFELGVDSIRLFQIVARANDRGLALTPNQVVSGRSVAGVCEELERAIHTPERADVPPLTAVSRDRHRVARTR